MFKTFKSKEINRKFNLALIRYAARLLSVVLFIQIMTFTYYVAVWVCLRLKCGFGFSESIVLSLAAEPSCIFLPLALAGVVVAWKREGLGGILMTVGVVGYHVLYNIYNSIGLSDIVLGFTVLPGVLFMFYGFASKRQISAATQELHADGQVTSGAGSGLVPAVAS